MRAFWSDNASGAHPRILEAVAEANAGHAVGYGGDRWTSRAEEALRATFGDVRPLLVFGGTGANLLALRAVCERHHSVLCAETAHLWRDECGGPELVAGVKLVPVPVGADGKLSPDVLAPHLALQGGVHHAQPRLVSVSQATELGAVYTADELRALAGWCHEHGLLLHVDGARLANAAASLGTSLAGACTAAGADVVSFGGTKNGLLFGEAVLVRDGLGEAAPWHRKQLGQLPSKLRYVSAQIVALLEDGLWRELASDANARAASLGAGLEALPGVSLAAPVQANMVFARLPTAVADALADELGFLVWARQEERAVVRLLCSWDTTDGDVQQVVAAVRRRVA